MIRLMPPSEEALLLKEMGQRFIADHYDLPKRRAMLDEPAENLPKHWRDMASLGWLAAPLPEAAGGLGMAPAELLPLLEALGAGLVLEPYGPAILQCAAVLTRALPDAETALAPMVAGERIEVLAGVSENSSINAERNGDHWVLIGNDPLVAGGAAAEIFWVAAKTPKGLMLMQVPAREAQVAPSRLPDGQSAAKVSFDSVTCNSEAFSTGVEDALAYGRDMALFGALGESTGLINALYSATLDYVKLREQFGRPIGRFQVVQHRMADMFICAEEAKSMARLAAEALESEDIAFRQRQLSAARVKISANARSVMRDAIQLHGGMGVTDELAIGHMVKRLLVLNQAGGDRAAHLTRFQTLAHVTL